LLELSQSAGIGSQITTCTLNLELFFANICTPLPTDFQFNIRFSKAILVPYNIQIQWSKMSAELNLKRILGWIFTIVELKYSYWQTKYTFFRDD
jgi:hypothetical protein